VCTHRNAQVSLADLPNNDTKKSYAEALIQGLEATRVENRTQDFTGQVKRITLDFIEVTFTYLQQFLLENLEKEGWST
jgi:hypothetical protein